MDTLTHALSGALIARLMATRQQPATAVLGVSTPGRLSAPWDGAPGAPPLWQLVLTGTVAGAFPDIDVVAQQFGDIAYLLHHRGITHALPMLPLWAALVAWLLAQLLPGLRGQRSGWKSLYAVAAAAIGIHIAGDWITQFGTMLLEPFSDRRFGLGAIFIIDLVISGALLAGLLLAAVFPRRRWPAALGLGAVCAWVGVAWVGQQEALEVAAQKARALGAPQAQVVVMPRPASPFNWTVSVFDGTQYHVAHVNTRRAEPLVAGPDANFVRRFSAPYQPVAQATWQQVPRFGPAGTPEWVAEAFAHERFAFFRWFAPTPALLAAEERALPGGGSERCAFFRDLRFDFPGRDESPFRYGLCLEGSDPADVQVYRLEGGQRRPV